MKVFFTVCILLSFYQISFASIKITSYNIRNFGKKGSYTDLKELRSMVSQLNSDIIGVQEIVNKTRFQKFIEQGQTQHKVIFSKCGGRGDQHLGIVYNSQKLKLIEFHEEAEISDVSLEESNELGCNGSLRPILIGNFIEISTRRNLLIMVVHLKAGGGWESITRRAKQFEIISKTISKYENAGNKDIVVLGDFNTTGYVLRNTDYLNFQRLISTTKSFDISEQIECSAYWSGIVWDDNIEEPSILDHILFSNNIYKSGLKNIEVAGHCKKVSCQSANLQDLGISYNKVSDHCPISATIE